MRKLLLLLLALSAVCTGHASHLTGSDIRYVPEGNKYRVYLILYASCEPNSVALSTMETMYFEPAGACGQPFSRVFQRVANDTLTELFCPSALVGCGSWTYPYTIMATYSDTVSLPPCLGWTMKWASCCRAGSISNIFQPSAQGMYVEAFLNNLAALNASPKIGNFSRPVLGVNTTNTLSLQATDLQGDSIAYELISARQNLGGWPMPSPVNYAAGYSAAQPVGGSGTVLNSAGATLQLTPGFTGRYTIALRIKDYRQGTLMGYSEREWDAFILPGANATPVPSAATVFQHVTCPGQTHSIPVTFVDPGDSVVISATPDAAVTWPVTVTGGAGIGSATATLSWTTPATLNVSNTPHFYIRLKVRDSTCLVRGIAWHDILVRTAYCNTDTVWAGDADANKIVDLYDPLAISVAWGKTGAARPGASTAWAPQTCPNWSTSFLNNVNHKHADCDGNGTVGASDLTAVNLNYGQTHPRPGGDEEPPAKTAGLPDLYFDLLGVAPHAGSTVSVPIKLGSAGSAMSSLYGLSARIQIAGVAPASAPTVTYPASWLGTAANTLRFAKPVMSNTALDWSYARTTGMPVSGDGTLGELQVAIPANTPPGTQMILRFLQPRIIGPTGAEITAYNVVYDTLTVLAPTGIDNASSAVRDVFVVPNPSDRHALLHLSLNKAQTVHVSITDAVGRAAWTQSIYISGGRADLSLSEVEVPAGMYFVRVQPGDGSAGRVVKWVRE